MRHDEHDYPNVVRAVAETPWAMIPERFAVIREVIASRARGERLSDEEIQSRIGAGPARRQPARQSTVAIIPVYGVIVPRATLFTKMSGGTALTDFQDSLANAVNDQAIDSILLDFDSPGGSTDFVPETAAAIRAARSVKPVWGIANAMAASAAYWLLSQCNEAVVTPSGEVGSIGVFAAHEDYSAQLEQEGVKVTLIRAGKFKAETNPFEPLSDEAKAALQERVDEFYGMFVRDVAKGRNVSVDAVRGGFGEGRVVTAKNALATGMVDAVDTFEATVQRMIRAGVARKDSVAMAADEPPGDEPDETQHEAAASGLSFADEAAAARDACARVVNRTRSLAEFRDRGRLTAAKRDQLSALDVSLVEAHDALQELLAETDPDKQADELLRERARFEFARTTTL